MTLADAASRALNTARTMRLFKRPGHFYSPIWSVGDADRAREQRADLALDEGYELREAEQLELATRLGPMWSEFSGSWDRYRPANSWFDISDGAVYYSMLTTLRPRRVIEVGSGFSSAVALDVRDKELPALELTFIEPYPERLRKLLKNDDHAATTIHQSAVQDVPIETFDVLESGDVLFIDSTHVSKAGSDVNWLFFRILPRLKPGVVVQVHDIFYPFEYPDNWLDERRSWNEAYLLRSFLSYNDSFEIVFFSSWFWQTHNDVVAAHLPEAANKGPGSIWLKRSNCP